MSEYESKLNEVLNAGLDAGKESNPAQHHNTQEGNLKVDPVDVMARWKILQDPVIKQVLVFST